MKGISVERWERVFFLGLNLLIIPLIANASHGLFEFGGDNAIYLTLSRALWNLQGLKNLFYPGNPPHCYYPFGFPLILAPLNAFKDHVPFLAHISIGCWAFFSLHVLRKYLLSFMAPIFATLISLTLGVLPSFHYETFRILSEFPFLFFVILSFIGLTKWKKQEHFLSPLGIQCVVWVIFAYFIRTAGFALVAAGMLYLLLPEKNQKPRLQHAVLLGSAFILTAGGWWLRNRLNQCPGLTYGSQLGGWGQLATTLRDNLAYYDYKIPKILFDLYLHTDEKFSFIGQITLLGIGAGWVYSFSTRRQIHDVFFIFYLAMVLLWPQAKDPRLLLPIYPWFIYYLFQAIGLLTPKSDVLKTSVMIFLLGLNLYQLPKMWRWAHSAQPFGTPATELQQALSFFREKTPKQAIVLSRKPAIVYWLGNQQGVRIPCSYHAGETAQRMLGCRVDYFLADQLDASSAQVGRFFSERGVFSEVAAFGETRIYQVNRDKLRQDFPNIPESCPFDPLCF